MKSVTIPTDDPTWTPSEEDKQKCAAAWEKGLRQNGPEREARMGRRGSSRGLLERMGIVKAQEVEVTVEKGE